MGAVPALFRVSAPILALCWLTACGGERVRLGDGPALDVTALDAAPGASDETTSTATDSTLMDSTAMDTATAETSESTDAAGCERGATAADQVLWIGDSWFTIPGTQRTGVQDRARAAGALAPDADYVSLAAPASRLSTIVQQYATRQSGSPKVEVLIMDGGTWDTIVDGASDASVAQVVETFTEFLRRVDSDGTVEHILYMLMPELPTIPGVAQLRPGLMQACEDSVVPCHFLDLQPLWMGHPEYTAPDGIQASELGAQVIADAIWATMQTQCIAQ